MSLIDDLEKEFNAPPYSPYAELPRYIELLCNLIDAKFEKLKDEQRGIGICEYLLNMGKIGNKFTIKIPVSSMCDCFVKRMGTDTD